MNTTAKKKMPARMRKMDIFRWFGIERKELDRYLGLPGAPKPSANKTYSSLEISEWIAKAAKNINEKDVIKQLRAKKLGLECERITLELSQERSILVPKAEIVPVIARLWGELHALLRQKFEFELPQRCAGRNAIEISQFNIEALAWVDSRFKAGADLTP